MKTKLLRKIRRRFRYAFDCTANEWVVSQYYSRPVDAELLKSTHDAANHMAQAVLKNTVWNKLCQLFGITE